MKKALVCLILALVLVFAGQRQVMESVSDYVRAHLTANEQAEPPAQEPLFTAQEYAASDEMEVTLYYRFGQTALLGMERARLDAPKSESQARSIVEKLVAGPDAAHGRLSGVFPSGTRVLSVKEEGDIVYVTLSEAFLGRPDGAPLDWEDLTVWQEEATLRRWLAAQSIVCALTEGGRCQRVQLYVAQSEADAPQRIPLAFFDLDASDPAVVLAAISRDEQAIMTPKRAMQAILNGWQKRDWARVYDFLCAAEGERLPTLSVFEAQMRELDVTLLTVETSEGTVGMNGQTATVVLDGAIRSAAGGDMRLIRESVPLVRTADNWTMRMDTLLKLMRAE